MSWRSWIVLSLAWETSLSLVSAMAVNNRGSVLDVNTKTDPDCGTCNLDQRDDTTLQPSCNRFWFLDNGASQVGFLAMADGMVGCSAFKNLKQHR